MLIYGSITSRIIQQLEQHLLRLHETQTVYMQSALESDVHLYHTTISTSIKFVCQGEWTRTSRLVQRLGEAFASPILTRINSSSLLPDLNYSIILHTPAVLNLVRCSFWYPLKADFFCSLRQRPQYLTWNTMHAVSTGGWRACTVSPRPLFRLVMWVYVRDITAAKTFWTQIKTRLCAIE